MQPPIDRYRFFSLLKNVTKKERERRRGKEEDREGTLERSSRSRSRLFNLTCFVPCLHCFTMTCPHNNVSIICPIYCKIGKESHCISKTLESRMQLNKCQHMNVCKETPMPQFDYKRAQQHASKCCPFLY